MAKAYDLLVIGSGVAAQTASLRVRAAGWSVAVVDHLPLGGTCQLRGCDPKKVLVGAAEAIEEVRRHRDRGVAGESRIDWRALIAFKRRFTDPVPAEQQRRYGEAGIDVYHGLARFVGRNEMTVGGETIAARHVLLASGARPVPLGIDGAEHVATSDRFFELDALPARLVLIGGGYIAAEFSHIAARAGAQVTILQRDARLLTRFDPDLVSWLMDKFREIGITVRTGTTVDRVEKLANGFRVRGHAGAEEVSVEGDLVIHAAGRAPDLDALDPGAGGLALDRGRLVLNDFLQSVSNPAVYAAGDAAAKGPPLTPIARRDGEIVAMNLLKGNRHRPNYLGVPSVAFTLPPIAAVGLSEEEAREQGLAIRTKSERGTGWYTARRINESVYGYKTLVEEGTGRIIGAHLVGPHAEEVINLFGLAIRHGLSADALKSSVFSYPTSSSDIGYML